MGKKLRNLLGFPYPPEYEPGFYQTLMKRLHKPLLLAVIGALFLVSWLLATCILWPDSIAPESHVRGLFLIHFAFELFTILILALCIGLRRQLFEYPRLHLFLCNSYAIGVCAWSNVLSAYADYSASVYTAFVFITLCVSLIALFKPWLAVLVFSSNYAVYVILVRHFMTEIRSDYLSQLASAAMASLFAVIIATAFYRFRTRTYYDKQIILQQMKEIHQINRQLKRMIHVDTLTGLLNRRYYDDVLPVELAKLNEDDLVCAVMLDVDFFKNYNDHFGHPKGDVCLQMVGGIIQESLKERLSFAVRYGGEEFFVVARVRDEADAMELAQGIRQGVESAFILHPKSPFGKVTVSGGLILCDSRRDLAWMTKQADDALYHAKQVGRNHITLWERKTNVIAL